ncbi:hypothetical protein F4778DRAFT_772655 [Xylariomycetidae sp. FL2044]|nr:hypothetical protein F4778DRAFT_772655 [Xylariomycetidae sp. FL2044]
MTHNDAVLRDTDAQWRYGQPPDYTKTRKFYMETKKCNHEPGSLPNLVENLVKNWEIEASFKMRLEDWRTIDHDSYTFAINGREPSTAQHMLGVGTYNAIITANPYYDPTTSDFAKSHKTFKRMMPTFAWEVLEVYSGPPVVAFKWRHWGQMKNDYVGWNTAGEKITVKATDKMIDVEGITVAHLNDAFKVTKLETWFDPNEMFRQMDPEGHALTKAVAKTGKEDEGEGGASTEALNELAEEMQRCPVMK